MQPFSIFFEPDGYQLTPSRIMGRHSAGAGFLRAAVNNAVTENQSLVACVANQSAARQFAAQTRGISEQVKAEVEPVEALVQPDRHRGLYVPGPSLSHFASIRYRGRVNSFSIVGVTHTIASHAAMTSITELIGSSIMPWDALICTSTAVQKAVQELLQQKLDFLQWRLKLAEPPVLPRFPVIPLGVHTSDYIFSDDAKRAARKRFKLKKDEIAVLFFGRLSFHAKAHPYPMYVGAEQVARATGKKIVLIMCGLFPNDAIRDAFVEGAASFFPSGRTEFVDGSDDGWSKASWAAADIFVSLSDNIQESFGLTPIEAMAAGLPVIVTDWDGYRDTVRDEVDGYRIPVTDGMAAIGEVVAHKYEVGSVSYDTYCGLTCMMIAPDMVEFKRRLQQLVEDPALRAALGGSGREHVSTNLDWRVIYQRYRNLFAELDEIRTAQGAAWESKRRRRSLGSPDRLAPNSLFAEFATHAISIQDVLVVVEDDQAALKDRYQVLAQNPMFSFAKAILPATEVVEKFGSFSGKTLQVVSADLKLSPAQVVATTAVLLKMGLVQLVKNGR